MKITLAFLPAWLPLTPPLGITALGTFLKNQGVEVDLLDLNSEFYKATKNQTLWDMENAILWMKEDKYRNLVHPTLEDQLKDSARKLAFSKSKVVGFSIYSSNYRPTRVFIKLLRKLNSDLKVILGGPGINKEQTLVDIEEGLIDAAILGEGEVATLNLLKYWDGKLDKQSLGNIILKTEEGILEGPTYPLMKMREVAIPDFNQFNLQNYFSEVLPIEFSRGCVASCTFCSETNYWVSFRTKTIDQIIDEFKSGLEKHKIDTFRVVDSLMNGNMKLLTDLCERILEEGLNVKWFGYCRINPKMTPDVLDLLKRAGCVSIMYGLETGSQKVLDLMNKKVDIKDNYIVVKDTFAAGLRVEAEILVGFPGESLLDYLKTLYMLYNLRNVLSSVSTGSPMEVVRNSEVFDNPEKFGVRFLKSGWASKTYLNNHYTRQLLFHFLNFYLKIIGIQQSYTLEDIAESKN